MERISSTSYTASEWRCLLQKEHNFSTVLLRPINKTPSVSTAKPRMISNSRSLLILAIFHFILGWSGIVQCQTGDGSQKVEQQIQCYACGLPKVNPDNDIIGSYGKKIYNHSCVELDQYLKRGKEDSDYETKFVRTCPVGVRSCFGAKGFYDRDDARATNDISVAFLGCSEAKHKHDYGCDEEDQAIDVKDKHKKLNQIQIKVNLCFCSNHLCNHPDGGLFNGATHSYMHGRLSYIAIAMAVLLIVRVTNKL